MAFKPFRKVRLTTDAELDAKHINALQDNVEGALAQLLGKDALDVTLVKGVNLVAGLNKVPHKLGRMVTGYYVTRAHGGYPWIYDVQDTCPVASQLLLLYLMSATAVSVDLMVF